MLVGAFLFVGNRSLTTTDVSELDWQASPFKVYVAQPEAGDQYKIVALYSDGTDREEITTMSKANWREQQEKYMLGYRYENGDYVGSNISSNGRLMVTANLVFLWFRQYNIHEGEKYEALTSKLVWPYTWSYNPEAFYWMPDSKHILVEDKGSIYIVQATDGEYAKLIEGRLPSLYEPIS